MFFTSNEEPTSFGSLLQEDADQTKSLITICPYDADILLIAHVFISVTIIPQSLSALSLLELIA
jgi:hypothetical protein